MSAQRPVQPPILEPDLLRVLGHELRSPLASLLGYAELMRDDDEAADHGTLAELSGSNLLWNAQVT